MWLWNREMNIYINELHGSRLPIDKALHQLLLQFNNDAFIEKFMLRFVERC